MLSWLSNNPDAVVAIVTIVGGWLGLTRKKANTTRLKEQLLTKLRSEIHALIETYASPKQARKHLDWAAGALLDELGLKRTETVDMLIAPILEQALKEYSERIAPRIMQLRLEELHRVLSKLPSAFDANPAIPKLEESSNVEIIPPTGNEIATKPYAKIGAAEDK